MHDGQGNKTALPMWGIFVKKLQQDPEYKSYFNSYWPEEYKYINDCPFSLEEGDLIELGVDPGVSRDSTYMGPRKFKLKQEHGIRKVLDDIFGSKEDKEKKGKDGH